MPVPHALYRVCITRKQLANSLSARQSHCCYVRQPRWWAMAHWLASVSRQSSRQSQNRQLSLTRMHPYPCIVIYLRTSNSKQVPAVKTDSTCACQYTTRQGCNRSFLDWTRGRSRAAAHMTHPHPHMATCTNISNTFPLQNIVFLCLLFCVHIQINNNKYRHI